MLRVTLYNDRLAKEINPKGVSKAWRLIQKIKELDIEQEKIDYILKYAIPAIVPHNKTPVAIVSDYHRYLYEHSSPDMRPTKPVMMPDGKFHDTRRLESSLTQLITRFRRKKGIYNQGNRQNQGKNTYYSYSNLRSLKPKYYLKATWYTGKCPT